MDMGDLIPVVSVVGGILMVFGIPIVAILTHHQRKMAELIHRNSQNISLPTSNPQADQDLRDLKAQVRDLTYAVDELRRSVQQLPSQSSSDVANRLQQ